ncbi:MAG: hypothetical protein JKX72_03210 [Robiginitomaculum sp.]|nr:hypothetical protein [Robiginitomaculum sp.]
MANQTFTSGRITSGGASVITAVGNIAIAGATSGSTLDILSSMGAITMSQTTSSIGTARFRAQDDISLVSLSSDASIIAQTDSNLIIANGAEILADQDGVGTNDVLVLRAGGNVTAGAGSSILGGRTDTADVVVTAGFGEAGPTNAGNVVINNVSGSRVRLNAQGVNTGNVTVNGNGNAATAMQITATNDVFVNGALTAGSSIQIMAEHLVIDPATGTLASDRVDLVSRSDGFSLGDVAGATNFTLTQGQYNLITANTILNLYATNWGTAVLMDTATFNSLIGQEAATFSGEFYDTTRPDVSSASMAGVTANDFIVGDFAFGAQASSIVWYTIASGGGEDGDVLVTGNVTNGGISDASLDIGDFQSSASGWRPNLVHVTGSIGNNGPTSPQINPNKDNWLNSVEIAANTIVFGSDDFFALYLASLQNGPDTFRPEQIRVGLDEAFKIWLASETITFKSSVDIVQQNTGSSGSATGNTFGIFTNAPLPGNPLIRAFIDGSTVGPGRIDLFGVLADGTVGGQLLFGSTVALAPGLLIGSINREASFRINACAFGTAACDSVGDFFFEPSLETITSQIDALYSPDDEEEREAVVGMINIEYLK